MPLPKVPNPLIGEPIPDRLPATQAADEALMKKGEAVDKACRVYKGTLNINNIPAGSMDYRDYEAWLRNEIPPT